VETALGSHGQLRLLVYAVETAIRATADAGDSTPRGGACDLSAEQIAVIVDFSALTLRTAPSRRAALRALRLLQAHYPERLGAAVVINPPQLFSLFYNAIRPFLDARTAAKVHLLAARDPARVRDHVASIFPDLALVERSLGGDAPPEEEFEPERYARRMLAEEEALRR